MGIWCLFFIASLKWTQTPLEPTAAASLTESGLFMKPAKILPSSQGTNMLQYIIQESFRPHKMLRRGCLEYHPAPYLLREIRLPFFLSSCTLTHWFPCWVRVFVQSQHIPGAWQLIQLWEKKPSEAEMLLYTMCAAWRSKVFIFLRKLSC